MKLRTYVGRDAQEALAQVRRELGPEAVILSSQSRRCRAPGSGWSEGRRVEVTAAADQAVALASGADFQPWTASLPSSRRVSLNLKEELEEMKALLKQWIEEQGPPPWLAPYPELTQLFQALVRAGVNGQLMRRWLEKLRTSLANAKSQPPTNLPEQSVRQLVREVEVVDTWQISPAKPQRWALLGPTGVGKTTTIAKLAIQAAFVKKLRVGLISLDSVRLGGQEHLAAYARISGLPMVMAQTRGELAEVLEKMADLDLILIDTPGRNPCDLKLPLELHQLFGNLPGVGYHLVVSATAAEANIADAFQGFKVRPLLSCIIAKVDESQDIVGVFNQLWKRQIPVSYLTTGQKVPEDLEPATPRLLAHLLLKPFYGRKAQR